MESFLKAAKVEVAGRERTTDKETDFKVILTCINAKNSDVVFYGGMDMTADPMLRQARELGIKAVFAFGDGMVCSQAGPPREAASPAFTKAFNAKFGKIQQYSPLYYDATNAVIEAMKAAESVDTARFTAEIYKVAFSGATGDGEV